MAGIADDAGCSAGIIGAEGDRSATEIERAGAGRAGTQMRRAGDGKRSGAANLERVGGSGV